jgi:hypothetical protein
MNKDKKFFPILTVLLSIFLVSGICVSGVDFSTGPESLFKPLTKNGPVIGQSGTIDDSDMEIASAASKKRVGSWNSNVYHKTSCKYVKQIKKSNKRTFASATSAKRAGYRACKICKG